MTYTRFDRSSSRRKRDERLKQAQKAKNQKRRQVFFISLFSIVALFALGSGLIFLYVYNLAKDLPDIDTLADYQYNLPTQVFDRNGKLAAEYYEQRRILISYDQIPKNVLNAVIAIEDNRFFKHDGIDLIRIAKAFYVNLTSWSFREGASTLTQQTAKQFLLSSEKKIARKIKEILLALQIEEKYGKKKILELYLNKAFFGRQSYGIEAAAQNYFSKSISQLNTQEAALLAGLLKAPSKYSPTRDIQTAKRRRDLVLTMMYRNSFITKEELICAKQDPVILRLGGRKQTPGVSYFIEEIRRTLLESFGKDSINTGGFQITTTLDLELQVKAQKALENGLEVIDMRHGYRGPMDNILEENEINEDKLAELTDKNFSDSIKILTGVVTNVSADSLTLDLGVAFGKLALENADWAIPMNLNRLVSKNNKLKKLTSAFRKGDVILVRLLDSNASVFNESETQTAASCDLSQEQLKSEEELKDLAQFEEETSSGQEKQTFEVSLYQTPENNGALMAMNPHNGEIYAIAGGYSYAKSQFNRATQSKRQPGSAFKPFVYATALLEGYKPNDILEDTPLVFQDLSNEFSWIPKNYGGGFSGLISFRDSLVKSKNIPTIKIMKDVGVSKVINLLKKAGVDTSDFPRDLSLSLGSGSITLLDMITAYSMFPNKGNIPKPVYIQKIEDRNGKVLYQPVTEQNNVIDPETAFIMHSMLSDVVQRGTGRNARKIGRDSAGKTGTTNNNTDAWYIGYIPNLIAGVYVGNDTPIIPLGIAETGGRAALPIWADFMKYVTDLKRKEFQAESIPQPLGIVEAKVSRSTGRMACGKEKDTYTEYFKTGQTPAGCGESRTFENGHRGISEDEFQDMMPMTLPQVELPSEIEL